VDGEGVPSTMEILIRYLDDYTRDGDDWLIAHRTVAYQWTRITPVDGSGLA
jgi:hypothetical protein